MKKNISNGGGGLGTEGIIIISIIGVLVVAGVVFLYTFIIKKNKKTKLDDDENSISSIKKTFTSSYY